MKASTFKPSVVVFASMLALPLTGLPLSIGHARGGGGSAPGAVGPPSPYERTIAPSAVHHPDAASPPLPRPRPEELALPPVAAPPAEASPSPPPAAAEPAEAAPSSSVAVEPTEVAPAVPVAAEPAAVMRAPPIAPQPAEVMPASVAPKKTPAPLPD